jgi:putative ABC transport system permease protein
LPEPQHPKVNAVVRLTSGLPASVGAERMKAAVAARPPSLEMPASAIKLKPRTGDVRNVRTAYVILGFAALIFVAACANLGNMLFARATEREGELAVRFALGAGRWHVFGLLFSETILICASAAGLALVFADSALRMFTGVFPAFQFGYRQRITLDLSLDWRIFTFAVGAGAIAAVAVGAASLWRSGRASLLTRLAAAGHAVVAKTEGRTLRSMLVSVQVTAAVLLLIATGMLLENSSQRLNRRLWFDTASLVTARIDLPDSYGESRGPHFYSKALTDIRAIPGVTAAALADALPGGESPAPRSGLGAFQAEPPERGLSGVQRRIDGAWIHATPGFVATLGLALERGRDFRDSDLDGTEPVVLISAATAQRFWPGADPIGKRLACCGATYMRRVVGVVPDPIGAVARAATHDVAEAMAEQNGDSGATPFVFVPAAQAFKKSMLVVVRSDSPRAIVQPLRDRIAALDADVPVFDAGPVAATQFTRLSAEKGVRLLAGALGLIALGIAICGVYAVVGYFVSRRTREFGLRLALGSTRAQVGKLVIDYAIHIVLIGLLPGVLFASWGTRYFQNELRDLHPSGLTVWIAVPLLMLIAGIIAAYIPARRAARTDPYVALKDL